MVRSAAAQGAPLLGVLPRSGVGEATDYKKCISEQQLLQEARKGNRAVRKRARCDEHAAELHALAAADAALGRMTAPVPAGAEDGEGRVLTPRFAVVQGCKADGTPRVRSIDDCTASRINRATQPQENMRHNTVDALFEVAKGISQARGNARLQQRRECAARAQDGAREIGFYKADIDAAFRRVAIRPDHRAYAWVAYTVDGVQMTSQHLAMPFGAGARMSCLRRARAARRVRLAK